MSMADNLVSGLRAIDGMQVSNASADRKESPRGVVLFICRDVHPHEVAQIQDRFEIVVRARHHCAPPLLKFPGVMATTRTSFGISNTEKEFDRLLHAITKVFEFLRSRFTFCIEVFF